MVIRTDQFEIIWRAIRYWMDNKHLSPNYLSLLTAGKTEEVYSSDRIARGINNRSEPVTPGFVRICVEIFGLIPARRGSPEDMANSITDEECFKILTAPLQGNNERLKLF